VPTVLEYGSLNLLEPSGPVKACNGIALPFISLRTQYVFITKTSQPKRFSEIIAV
jgi:hypothetical protein